MPASKLKNLIIVILLLANLLLLLLVLPARRAARQHNQATVEALAELYRNEGVSLSAKEIPQTLLLQPSTLTVDRAAVQKSVVALLGEDTTVEEADGALLFSSAKGTASLSYGVLEVLLSVQSSDARKTTEDCLKLMGAEKSIITLSQAGEVATATVDFLPGGAQILDRPLEFSFENGYLTRILGFLLPQGQTISVSESDVCISAADALVKFLADRQQVGWTGTEVLSVTQGWTLQQNLSQGDVPLRPAWSIATDAGTYLVDGISRYVHFSS